MPERVVASVQDRLLRLVARPAPPLRALAALTLLALVANLFWHGAQPYAVGLVPAPWDKLAHLALYFGMTGLFALALGHGRAMVAVLLAVAVGGADELAQLMNPGRGVSWADWAADGAGALLAGAVVRVAARRTRDAAPSPARTAGTAPATAR